MSENRLPDYLDYIRQAAADACSFVAGVSKDDFLADKRTHQAVIMSIIIGEAATKVTSANSPPISVQPPTYWHRKPNVSSRQTGVEPCLP